MKKIRIEGISPVTFEIEDPQGKYCYTSEAEAEIKAADNKYKLEHQLFLAMEKTQENTVAKVNLWRERCKKLILYTKHSLGCQMRRLDIEQDEHLECTCGLDELLKEIGND
jgi:hypothetical protein